MPLPKLKPDLGKRLLAIAIIEWDHKYGENAAFDDANGIELGPMEIDAETWSDWVAMAKALLNLLDEEANQTFPP